MDETVASVDVDGMLRSAEQGVRDVLRIGVGLNRPWVWPCIASLGPLAIGWGVFEPGSSLRVMFGVALVVSTCVAIVVAARTATGRSGVVVAPVAHGGRSTWWYFLTNAAMTFPMVFGISSATQSNALLVAVALFVWVLVVPSFFLGQHVRRLSDLVMRPGTGDGPAKLDERLRHEADLRILGMLVAVEQVSLQVLRSMTPADEGGRDVIDRLEDLGFGHTEWSERRGQLWFRATDDGRAAFRRHVAALRSA